MRGPERIWGGGRGSQGDGVGWMFNDNYAVGGTDRYHTTGNYQATHTNHTYFKPSSKLKKLIAFIKTLLLIMFGWTSTFKSYFETPMLRYLVLSSLPNFMSPTSSLSLLRTLVSESCLAEAEQ